MDHPPAKTWQLSVSTAASARRKKFGTLVHFNYIVAEEGPRQAGRGGHFFSYITVLRTETKSLPRGHAFTGMISAENSPLIGIPDGRPPAGWQGGLKVPISPSKSPLLHVSPFFLIDFFFFSFSFSCFFMRGGLYIFPRDLIGFLFLFLFRNLTCCKQYTDWDSLAKCLPLLSFQRLCLGD